MRDPASLAGLLSTLLSLPESGSDYATPSFAPWLAECGEPWPPTRDGGLWLMDTRDRVGRTYLKRGLEGGRSFDAMLVLAGSGAPGTPVRRVLRRLRRPGTHRMREERVRGLLGPSAHGRSLCRLGFQDGLHVPTSFELEASNESTGAAFLLTARPAFSGALWSFIREQVGQGPFDVTGLHLRTRGAAVAMVMAAGQPRVVRIVPDPRLQSVVRKNHAMLQGLRTRMSEDPRFLRVVPTPQFSTSFGSTLILGESSLPGVLAWKAARGTLKSVIYAETLEFLRSLREGTGVRLDHVQEGRVDLFVEDERRLAEARFIEDDVRRLMTAELRRGRAALTDGDVHAHASHGDFGYGNVLVDPVTGKLTGVIDWDTARAVDLPGIDRVNLELQIRPDGFADSVEAVWRERAAHEAIGGDADGSRARVLFGLAVCRFIMRSFPYPAECEEQAGEFKKALTWLSRLGSPQVPYAG